MITDPKLQQLLANVAQLETALLAARASARRHAQWAGRGTTNLFGETDFLFGETDFVPRSIALQWCENAREDAVNNSELATKAYRRGMRDGEKKQLEFMTKFAEAVRTGDYSAITGRHDDPGKFEHLRELPRLLRERRLRADLEPAAPDPKAIAAQIVKAGARARGETPPPLPPVGSTARAIIDAGMRRRGENPDDQAETDQDNEGNSNGRKRRKKQPFNGVPENENLLDPDDYDSDDDDPNDLDGDLDEDEGERRRKRRKARKRDPDDEMGDEGDTDELAGLDEKERARRMRIRSGRPTTSCS